MVVTVSDFGASGNCDHSCVKPLSGRGRGAATTPTGAATANSTTADHTQTNLGNISTPVYPRAASPLIRPTSPGTGLTPGNLLPAARSNPSASSHSLTATWRISISQAPTSSNDCRRRPVAASASSEARLSSRRRETSSTRRIRVLARPSAARGAAGPSPIRVTRRRVTMRCASTSTSARIRSPAARDARAAELAAARPLPTRFAIGAERSCSDCARARCLARGRRCASPVCERRFRRFRISTTAARQRRIAIPSRTMKPTTHSRSCAELSACAKTRAHAADASLPHAAVATPWLCHVLWKL
jgi:hypothetical protein